MKKQPAPIAFTFLLTLFFAWTTAQTPPPKGLEERQAAKTATPGPGAPTKPPWREFKLNPKTTLFLDFTDSNPDMVTKAPGW